MLFIPKILVPKVLKCSLRGGHCVISHHFHIVSRRFRAVSGHFHVILCRVASNGDTSHSNNICTFFCHLHEIDINLINISEFLIYIINFVSPLKIYICIPFFNHFFSHFMVNSSNIFKKIGGGSDFCIENILV